MKVQEALHKSLFALESISNGFGISKTVEAEIIMLIKSALSEINEFKPVAFLVDGRIEQGLFFDKASADAMAEANCGTVNELYTSPISKELIAPSNAVIDFIWHKATHESVAHSEPFTRYRFTELLLKQLNAPEKG